MVIFVCVFWVLGGLFGGQGELLLDHFSGKRQPGCFVGSARGFEMMMFAGKVCFSEWEERIA